MAEDYTVDEIQEIIDEQNVGKTAQEEAQAPEISELDLLKMEIDTLKDAFLRKSADFENFRRRAQKEKEAAYANAYASALETLIPVFDNIERAMAMEGNEGLREGLELTMKQYCMACDNLGVVEINPVGETFDPKLHNAIMHIEDENYPENTVVEVFQKGCRIGDKIVRHAMVKVAN